MWWHDSCNGSGGWRCFSLPFVVDATRKGKVSMVFDKIKNAVTGALDGKDLGDVASDLGAGAISKYLDGITYPVSKDEVISALKNNGAPDSVVSQVDKLSAGSFDSADDIINQIKGKL